MEHQLQHAQKLESIGQLAAGIAHEINTPTQYVMNNTKFIQEAFEDLIHVLEEYQFLLESSRKSLLLPNFSPRSMTPSKRLTLNTFSMRSLKQSNRLLMVPSRISEIVSAMKNFAHPGEKDRVAADINKAIENTILVARNEWKYVSTR